MARSRSRPRGFLRKLGFALILAAIFLLWLALKGRPEQERTLSVAGERVFVADGDTLRIGGRTIRLEGLDAVELKQFCREADGAEWSCGTRARDALQALVAAGGLACTSRAGDRYGRAIARCRTRAVEDVGGALVTAGWAVNRADRGPGLYPAEEAAAKREGRGIWRGVFQRPDVWRATHAYHPKPVAPLAP